MIDEHYQIGEVAERVGLSLRTIRYYEEIGLVAPSGRTDGGFRLYTDSDVDRLRLVTALKPLGMSLDTMTELVECADRMNQDDGEDLGEVERRLETTLAQAFDRCDQLEERLGVARETLRRLSAISMRGSR